MITYILQYEIPLRMQFSNLGHDLPFWVMTQLTPYSQICSYNLQMSHQYQVISHLYGVTYLFES